MAKTPRKSKKGKKVRVDMRPNRGVTPRDRSWTRQYRQHGFEPETESPDQPPDPVADERVAHKGAHSRRRTVVIDDVEAPSLDDPAVRGGVVTMVRGPWVEVDDDAGRGWRCTVRRLLRTRLIEQRTPLVVGDRVRFRVVADRPGVEREAVIEHVGPRHGLLARTSRGREHLIAVNVDQALIVTSIAEPRLKPHLIDRYIVAAEHGGIPPVVCFNKVDLDTEGSFAEVRAGYEAIGYRTLATSATSPMSIDALADVLRDRKTVLAGQSGVGKSTLLNALQPDLGLKTAPVSRYDEKGRHTTTTAQLLRLAIGGYVVDTPGVRQLELGRIECGQIEACFVEFAPLVPDCAFADCTHRHEDGCAVQQAVEAGAISPQRYLSYVTLFEEMLERGPQDRPT